MTIPIGTNQDIEKKNHFNDTFGLATKRTGTGLDHVLGYGALYGTDLIDGVEIKLITSTLENASTNDVKAICPTESEGLIQELPLVAAIIRIFSDNANDTSAGTGARALLVRGLDSNFDDTSEIITMNGTTNVLTINEYIRLNDVVVLSAGTNGYNEGIIKLENNVTNGELGRIGLFRGARGSNRLMSSIQTVPNGMIAVIHSVDVSLVRSSSSTGVKEGMVMFEAKLGGLGAFVPFYTLGLRSDGSNRAVKDFTVFPIGARAKTDLKMTAFPDVNNSSFNANYVYSLISIEDAGPLGGMGINFI